MADWLLLRLPRNPGEEISWILADGRGSAITAPQTGPLVDIAPRAVGRRVCVLVPGTDVLLAEPEVPVKAGTKLQQVVPYALEEQLAEDIDDLHFAIGKRSGNSITTPVAVVSHALMDDWLTILKAAGITPDMMYADSELLPENPGHAVALLEDDVITVRPPVGPTICMPTDALSEALDIARHAGQTGEQSGRGLILYTGAAEWQHYSPRIEKARDQFDGIKVQLLTGGPLPLFVQQLPIARATNLLQGRYAQQNPRAVGWRSWRVAAILLAALIGLHIAGKAGELFMLKRAEKTVDASIDEAFRAAMPGEQNTINARRRMEQRLATVRSGGGGGLLDALGAVVTARSAAPSTVVQSLSYRNGALELKIAGPDADSLERINQALSSNGWNAEFIGGNVVAEGGYEGRVQIKPRGS
ncbi:MAG TPA: type II secretion system protein GspL [Steroidobacteraceae bacterium]|nr:type II secretion system protein GspL [Steroidobacteraceae bacterium]